MYGQIYNYIIPVMACICFLTFTIIGRRTPMKVVSRYFFVATIIILSIILLEIIEPFFKEPNYLYPNWQRWVISIAAYILRPIIAFVLILIMERDQEKQKWFYPVMTLPLAVNTTLLLISPICGIVYYFDDNNVFVNGPMRFMPFLTGFVYLALYFVLLVADMRRNGIEEWVVLIPVVISVCVSVCLEAVCNLLGSLPMACILGMIFYYDVGVKTISNFAPISIVP